LGNSLFSTQLLWVIAAAAFSFEVGDQNSSNLIKSLDESDAEHFIISENVRDAVKVLLDSLGAARYLISD